MAEASKRKTSRNKKIFELKKTLSFEAIGRVYKISRGRVYQIYQAEKKRQEKQKMLTP